MTIINPALAAAIAATGVPLSADLAPPKPLPSYLAAIGQAGSEYERALYAAYLQAMAEVGRLRDELAELEAGIAWRDAERGRWADVHTLVERAIEKGWSVIDPLDLEASLGPEAGGPR